jgi:hypothetical protein
MRYANLVRIGPQTWVDPSKVHYVDYDDDGDLFIHGDFGDMSDDEFANRIYPVEWVESVATLVDVLMGENYPRASFWTPKEDTPNPNTDAHSAFDED